MIACSAGNHAQGVALGATKNGIKSLICLPSGAPISKVEATKKYGAEVCLVDGVYDDAYQKALQLKEEKGYTFVHPFDDENVIAGQGTIGIELLDQLPDVDAVIVPVGGGGLISGVAFAIKSLRPNVKVYGVQASGAPSMVQSLSHKRIERLPSVKTIADGIAVKEPGTHTFDICSKYVDDVVTVTDDEISTAILSLIEQQKLIAEGAGAVSVAAAMFGKLPIEGKKNDMPRIGRQYRCNDSFQGHQPGIAKIGTFLRTYRRTNGPPRPTRRRYQHHRPHGSQCDFGTP